MDDELRARIWNVLYTSYFDKSVDILAYLHNNEREKRILTLIYDGFFKESADTGISVNGVKTKFFSLKWNRVYDFVGFMMDNVSHPKPKSVQDHLNSVLKAESAGYYIINSMVTPITNQIEITEIEQAANNPVTEVNNHLNTALQMLSSKTNPDPRNSIKESISAVEALLKKIGEDDKAVLDSALKKIKRKNPKLIDAKLGNIIQKLWDFSNDASGVRHASVEGKTVTNSDDAKFLLVICSAIVNYLIVKHGDFRKTAMQ